MPTPDQLRVIEFHSLIEKHSIYERNVRLSGWEPNDYQQADHAARTQRLNELAELINAAHGPSAQVDVAAFVERWIETHPLTMTGTGMKRVIAKSSGDGNGVAVFLQIGDPQHGGRFYPLYEGQFTYHPSGRLQLTLPDSIAEEFRQQGRRAVQRELASVMGVQSLA